MFRMVKFNRQDMRRQHRSQALALILAALGSYLLFNVNGIEARGDKGGDDIIMTKGKLIMRGGKGRGKVHDFFELS